jgi:hypothetical protein
MSHAAQQISSNLHNISSTTPVRKEELALYQTQPVTSTAVGCAVVARCCSSSTSVQLPAGCRHMLLMSHIWLSRHNVVHNRLQPARYQVASHRLAAAPPDQLRTACLLTAWQSPAAAQRSTAEEKQRRYRPVQSPLQQVYTAVVGAHPKLVRPRGRITVNSASSHNVFSCRRWH